MQDDAQLTVPALLAHGETVNNRSECRTWTGDGSRSVTFAEVGRNARRLASALAGLGVGAGDRVATLCWNTQEHLEAYFGVPSMGAVLHTLNLRLPPAQLAHIVNHAEDKVVIVDATLLPLLGAIAGELKTVEHVVVIGSGDTSALGTLPIHDYTALRDGGDAGFAWPEIDERSAASMCYTSGTTGDPKGVVYSHRSIYLHALASLNNTATGLSEYDRALVVVPMFHVNAWGMPFGAFFSGTTLLMPGPHMTPQALCEIAEREHATFIGAVPTLWAGMLQVARETKQDFSAIRIGSSGGAAIPESLLRAWQDEFGLRIIQGWGMTETSPIGGLAHPPADVAIGTDEEIPWRLKSGRVIAGVQLRIVTEDGEPLPWDGKAVGEIEVRGPWIAAAYHLDSAPEKFRDGWLRTGDIGTVDDRGYFQITDRSKDVIKSGGEWISSVELENLLAASPDVAEAAVVGIPDEKWTERPLALVVRASGSSVAASELAQFLDGKVASWQIPENWAFIEEVPKTSVGKFDKKVLRARHADGEFSVERTKAPGGR